MDKVIHKHTSFDALKADEYRDWQKLSDEERMNAVVEITLAAYQMKGQTPDVRRLQRTLVHLQRPESQISDRGRVWRFVSCAGRLAQTTSSRGPAEQVRATAAAWLKPTSTKAARLPLSYYPASA